MEYSIQDIVDVIAWAMALSIPIAYVISIFEKLSGWFMDWVTGKTVLK